MRDRSRSPAGPCVPDAAGQPMGQWAGYGRNAQHTGLTPGPSQLPLVIRWSTPIDLNPQYSGEELLIHYGSPAITAANTIIVPVKTGATGGFIVNGLNATTGGSFGRWPPTTCCRRTTGRRRWASP